MEKFLFLMHGLPAQPTASDEQTGAYNQKWGQYMGSLARRGASRPVRVAAGRQSRHSMMRSRSPERCPIWRSAARPSFGPAFRSRDKRRCDG